MELFQGRNVLAYLSVLYEGNWDKIFQAIQNKIPLDSTEVEKVVKEIKTPFITILDELYPEKLKHIYKPPFVLFYHGDLDLWNRPSIAVVGSRTCSEYSKKHTGEIVGDLAKKLVVISGLARGIDTIAHQSAIASGGKTIAILGSGIDECYPKSNQELYERICKDHLVISEYPLHTLPKKEFFPHRNRLLAAFSDAVLVMEAKEKSGTMHTVRSALEFGKEIFCIPHPIEENDFTNRLIQEGAFLVESSKEIFNELKLK